MGKTYVIVVAAGRSLRFGSDKQSALIRGKTVLDRSLGTLQQHREVDEIVLVLGKKKPEQKQYSQYSKVRKVVPGGLRRQDSVTAGFKEVGADPENVVLIHDGARPLVKQDLVSRVIKAARAKGAAVPVLPMQDTVKSVKANMVEKTLDRSRLFRCQTPQGFRYSVLKPALEKAIKDGYYSTDEASLVERTGGRVTVVPGDYTNIKITFPEDINIAEVFVED
jgi:2-C-methyl-D-erythritol 4-phosphate cytidylyltransferase